MRATGASGQLRVGEAEFELRGTIAHEPDSGRSSVTEPDVSEPTRELIKEAVNQGCQALVGKEAGAEDPKGRWTSAPDLSNFRTVIEDTATLEDIEPDFETLDWSINGHREDGRLEIEAELRFAGLSLVRSRLTQPGFNGNLVLLTEKIR